MKYSTQNSEIKAQKNLTSTEERNSISTNHKLPPLPLQRPLLLIGHGTRDADGKQTFLDFVAAYQNLDKSRPVIPCFLELTGPTIQEGVDKCVEQGYTEL
ncbi:sirohydrochlorin chelatase, partial [Okeania sp. SIO2B9]